MLGQAAPITLLSKRSVSGCCDRGGVASYAATERAASTYSGGAACGHCTYYEGGECCQDECIGGLKSAYLDGIETSLSTEEGAEPVGGDKLIWKCHDELAHGLHTCGVDRCRIAAASWFFFLKVGFPQQAFCDSRVISRQLGFVAFSWKFGTSVKLFMHCSNV